MGTSAAAARWTGPGSPSRRTRIGTGRAIYLVYLAPRFMPSAVRELVNFLAATFADPALTEPAARPGLRR